MSFKSDNFAGFSGVIFSRNSVDFAQKNVLLTPALTFTEEARNVRMCAAYVSSRHSYQDWRAVQDV